MPDEFKTHAARQGLCRIEALFHEALALPADQRTSFVASKCVDDASLAFELLDLIRLHDQSAGRMEVSPTVHRDLDPVMPERIGQYTVVRLIGEGGMGRVYEAIQDQPRRTVALKVLRRRLANRTLLRRFEYEAQVLAKLQHPNIANVYEAGTYDAGEGAQPFFAMEFIQGLPITAHAQHLHLNVEERLDLFLQACEGVEHAHRRGVIHRDLKPANMLVTGRHYAPQEAQGLQSPGLERAAQPKIIDFGIARTLDSDIAVTTMHTEAGQILGTLQYMSPEQCDGDAHEIDVRSDVYALGLILYELLYNARPYEIGDLTIFRAARFIKEQPPIKPSSINRGWQDDLETIVLKALEKDRAQRYQSVAALSEDIRRYLRREPISAHPPSAMYKLRLFARRNRAASTALAALALVLVAAAIVSATFAIGQSRARTAAEREKTEALRQSAIAGAINEFLNEDLLAFADPNRSANRELTLREALENASRRLQGRFDNEPLVRAALDETIGRTYLGLGLFPQAEPHLLEALRLRQQERGEGDPATIEAMELLGSLYKSQNRTDQATSMFTRMHEQARQALGDRHKLTLAAMNNLGSMHREAGRYELAESLFSQALAAARPTLGEDDQLTMTLMHNLSYLYQVTDRLNESEDFALQVLERRRQVDGEEHPIYLMGLHNLAQLYDLQKRHDEALDLITQVIATKERVLGPDHPETLRSLGLKGSFLMAMKRVDDAEPIIVRVYEERRRVLGEQHSLTLAALGAIGFLRLEQKQYEEAEQIYEALVATQRELLGPDHLEVAQSLNNLAGARVMQGRFDDAYPAMAEVIEIRGRRLGDTHRLTIASLRNLARMYQQKRRYQDALPLFERLRAASAVLEGETGANALEYAFAGAQVLLGLGRHDDAAAMALQCVEGRQATLGSDHVETIKTVKLLVQIYEAGNKSDEAEKWRAELP